MKITKILISALFLLGTGALSGCRKPAQPPAASADPASSAVEPAEKTICAERVRFEEVSDGDRIVLVNPGVMRAVSLIPEGSQLIALAVHGDAEKLTYLPPQTALFACEKTEDGALRLNTSDGWLNPGAENRTLVLDAEAETPAEWTLTDTDLTVRSANPEAGNLHLNFLPDYNRFSLAADEEITDSLYPETVIYRVSEGYTMPEDDGTGYRLTVYETSDIHGHIAESDTPAEYRLAWIADKIKKTRNSTGALRTDTTILLDAGDLFQGSVLSNLLHGEPVMEYLAKMDYDAVAIGNHEFDWGLEHLFDADATLKDALSVNHVPAVICNLFQNGNPVSLARPYVILNKTAIDENGNELPVTIGVIGHAENYGPSIKASLFSDPGYEIHEDPAAVSALAEELKQKQQCDAVILLTHSNAANTAELFSDDPNIDLVLGGHSHKSDYGRNTAGIVYASPADNATSFVRTELVFDADEARQPSFRDTRATTLLIPSREETLLPAEGDPYACLDPEIVELSDLAFESAADVLNTEVGYITDPIIRYEYFPESSNRACLSGNFHTWLIRRAADADVAFYNRYGMRQDLLIPAGSDRRVLTLADIYTLFPFENNLYVYELTMEELLEVYKYALTVDGDTLFAMMSGMTCYYSDHTVNALVKDGEPLYVNGVWQNGHEKDTVRLAVTDFMATSNRNTDGMDNPLYLWIGTDRLISDDMPSTTGFIQALEEEAAANNGQIRFPTDCEFICGEYPGN